MDNNIWQNNDTDKEIERLISKIEQKAAGEFQEFREQIETMSGDMRIESSWEYVNAMDHMAAFKAYARRGWYSIEMLNAMLDCDNLIDHLKCIGAKNGINRMAEETKHAVLDIMDKKN